MIGSLGSVEFVASEDSVKTFRDLSFSRQANFSEHAVINSKGLLEFTGLKAVTCSLKIILDASLGIIPVKELNTLLDIMNNHEAVALILGGDIQGAGLWVIESMNENLELITNSGEIFRVSVNLSLKEYLE